MTPMQPSISSTVHLIDNYRTAGWSVSIEEMIQAPALQIIRAMFIGTMSVNLNNSGSVNADIIGSRSGTTDLVGAAGNRGRGFYESL